MRSKLNKFLDGCPKWVQDEVWGENGMRAEIEQLQQRNAELERERDELAAHFSGLKKLVESWRGKAINDVTPIILAIERSPKTSLAEHDAEVARKGWLQGHFHRSTYGVQDAEVVMNEAFNYADRNYGVKDGG